MGDKSNINYSDTQDRISRLVSNNESPDLHNTANPHVALVTTHTDQQVQSNGSSSAVSILHKGQDSLSINVAEDNPGMFYR